MGRLKFLLTIIVWSFFSLIVHASKARVQALSNSFHLIDSQSIYKKPIGLIYLENLISLESGELTATTINNNAEVMAIYSLNEKKKIAMSFGHQDVSVVEARQFINTLSGSAFELAQNPLSVFYAIDDNLNPYVFSIFYSGKNDKLVNLKESSVGFSLGMELGKFQLNALYVPINFVEASLGKKFEGGGYWRSSASYLLDQTTFELTYISSKAILSTSASGADVINEQHYRDTVILGLADSNPSYLNLGEENTFFWGSEIISTRIHCKLNLSAACDKFFTSTTLPAWFGVETQASNWLTIRGSIKQTFFINTYKDEFGYPAASVSGATGGVSDIPQASNSTVVAAGLGIKFKNVVFDGGLFSGASQTLNTSDFLSQASLTYSF